MTRLFTHKLVHVLDGLFRPGRELELLPDPQGTGMLYVQWDGSHGGGGVVWVNSDCPICLEALRRARSDPFQGLRARHLLTALVERSGVERGWHLEQAARRCHGPRDQKRSHRERHLPPLHLLMHLFEHGQFVLDGRVKPRPERSTAKPRRGRKPDRRATYGGEHQGPLIRLQRHNRRTATVHVLEPLLGLLRSGPYLDVDDHQVDLNVTRHHNPRGDRPTRAERARIRMGIFDFARMRGWMPGRPRPLQPVDATDLLRRFAGVNVERIQQRRRTAVYLDVLLDDARALYRDGGIGIVEDPERGGDRILLRLTSPTPRTPAAAPKRPAVRPRPAPQAARRLAGVTATGHPNGHGPPLQSPVRSSPMGSADR